MLIITIACDFNSYLTGWVEKFTKETKMFLVSIYMCLTPLIRKKNNNAFILALSDLNLSLFEILWFRMNEKEKN